jgi:hypothetical protein
MNIREATARADTPALLAETFVDAARLRGTSHPSTVPPLSEAQILDPEKGVSEGGRMMQIAGKIARVGVYESSEGAAFCFLISRIARPVARDRY